MAILTRVNGSLKPVMNVDVDSYTNGAPDANLVTNGATVNAMGPKLDFFTLAAGGAVTADQMAAAVQSVQQLATIYMYSADIATGDLVVAVYPTAAWTTTTLDAALVGLTGWTGVTSATGATFA
jgi:hypothetical protein